MALNSTKFDELIVKCQKCPRLAAYASETKLNQRKNGFEMEDYWCKPVASFGNLDAHLLIVGLAPGRHGAGRTGRPFTGDYAGEILYRALHEFKLSSSKEAVSINDGLQLYDVRIANAVRCAPPQNKPLLEEILNCRPYLIQEIEMMKNLRFVLTLGNLAHRQLISSMGLKQTDFKFGHETIHTIPDKDWKLMNSYHPSRYNINTKRLTYQMFLKVIQRLTH